MVNRNPLILKVEGLWKSFNGNVVNEDVSIYVHEGELVSILGPNGAGKTTLIRQVYGELRPDKGIIEVYGMNPRKARVMGIMSVVPQEVTPFSLLRVKEHVEMLIRLRSIPRGKARVCAEEAMDMVGLRDYANALIDELSGGLKRLVLVASAIACRPRLILLDEPTVGIDVQNRRRIWEIIKGIKSEGSSIILTTHYIHEAEELSDKVYLMNKRIVLEGSPGDLRKRLSWVEVRLSDDNESIRVTWDEAGKVINELISRRVRFEVREPSLEDVFMEVMTNEAK